jgi:hypothetical protein
MVCFRCEELDSQSSGRRHGNDRLTGRFENNSAKSSHSLS